jgi:hypothetical protein
MSVRLVGCLSHFGSVILSAAKDLRGGPPNVWRHRFIVALRMTGERVRLAEYRRMYLSV